MGWLTIKKIPSVYPTNWVPPSCVVQHIFSPSHQFRGPLLCWSSVNSICRRLQLRFRRAGCPQFPTPKGKVMINWFWAPRIWDNPYNTHVILCMTREKQLEVHVCIFALVNWQGSPPVPSGHPEPKQDGPYKVMTPRYVGFQPQY